MGGVKGEERQQMEWREEGSGHLEMAWGQLQPGGVSPQMHCLTLKFIYIVS